LLDLFSFYGAAYLTN